METHTVTTQLVRDHDVEGLKWVCARGALLNGRGDFIPLNMAVQAQSRRLVLTLLALGADPNFSTSAVT